MVSRQPACDPCRRAKLACDHQRPVCRRCLTSNKATSCAYRNAPFRRKRAATLERSGARASPFLAPVDTSSITDSPRRNPYPNPGFLGSSSHAAIFDRIIENGGHASTMDSSLEPVSETLYSHNQSVDHTFMLTRAAEILRQLFTKFDLVLLKDLVLFWLARGVNLALAEPLVKYCAEAMPFVQAILTSQQPDCYLILATWLTQNSDRPLHYDGATALSGFTTQFCGNNVRWETLGIFLLAAIRATFDMPFFPSLYTTDIETLEFRKIAVRLVETSLELCLSLDCLNDLQLIFQYENFIVHSYMDGDQSLHVWRSLADVISSAFALGYHENILFKPNTPAFLIQLRRTAFARMYSADKNVAIFLGRPPRVTKRFSHFQIPVDRTDEEINSFLKENQHEDQGWDPDAVVSYRAETRWSALCASVKEDILELMYDGGRNTNAVKHREISRRAETLWQELPDQFRLTSSLKLCTRSPIECDFLASIRLNFLHVQFLLHLVLLDRLADPNNAITEIAQQMLALIVETVLFRERLANSGTTLIWKIAYYGLPAAGVILLAMLKHHEHFISMRSSQFRVWQDLSVLVAEIQMGSIVRPGDPNYALLSKAARTIQSFLETNHTEEMTRNPEVATEQAQVMVSNNWLPYLSPDPWNLEIGFWENLGEHPFLSNVDSNF